LPFPAVIYRAARGDGFPFVNYATHFSMKSDKFRCQRWTSAIKFCANVYFQIYGFEYRYWSAPTPTRSTNFFYGVLKRNFMVLNVWLLLEML
jgi:hypothetical protein